MRLVRGVWTPWATVWCLPCDLKLGKLDWGNRVIPPDPSELVDQEDGKGSAICDECRAMCWVREDVSILQGVCYAFNERTWEAPHAANLAQTGGMCAAAIVTFADSPRVIYVTAMDGHEITIGDYASEDDAGEGTSTCMLTVPFGPEAISAAATALCRLTEGK